MALQTTHPLLRTPVLVFFVIAAIAIGIWIRRDRRLDKMPGPKGWPLIGIGLGLPKKSAFMHKWGLEYGEVFKLRVGWYNWVVLNSPEAMKEIMDKQVGYAPGIYRSQSCSSSHDIVDPHVFQGPCPLSARCCYWWFTPIYHAIWASMAGLPPCLASGPLYADDWFIHPCPGI